MIKIITPQRSKSFIVSVSISPQSYESFLIEKYVYYSLIITLFHDFKEETEID